MVKVTEEEYTARLREKKRKKNHTQYSRVFNEREVTGFTTIEQCHEMYNSFIPRLTKLINNLKEND